MIKINMRENAPRLINQLKNKGFQLHNIPIMKNLQLDIDAMNRLYLRGIIEQEQYEDMTQKINIRINKSMEINKQSGFVGLRLSPRQNANFGKIYQEITE